ncbi:hypothetical protein [uncultured Rhodoblastus sp.]|uniref:hypothetical protein n=1 Tax=uncultured Rhodoblastus sp. TaxID=543037 RepID=UPI0025CE911C|nr:hypothetical protein [uncultured Rhodoblastus sp.]
MSKFSVSRFFRRPPRRAVAFRTVAFRAVASIAALWLHGAGAQAQTNPFRSLTDALGMTTETGEGPDFIRQTRPEGDKMDYSHLTGVDKLRKPIRTPAEVEADKAELVSLREKSAARMKKLGAEKMTPVAPAKAPPATDEKF